MFTTALSLFLATSAVAGGPSVSGKGTRRGLVVTSHGGDIKPSKLVSVAHGGLFGGDGLNNLINDEVCVV